MAKKKQKTRPGPPPIKPIPPRDLLKTRAYIIDIIDLSDAIMKKSDMLMKMFEKQNSDRNSDNYAQLVIKRVESIRNNSSMISKWGISAVNWSKLKNINSK